MELRNLEYFVAVADEQSFDKAASKFYLTQSAVSQQVRRLEADLGAKLIDRSTRPFTLTGAGRDVYALAKSMLRQASSIRGIAAEYVGPTQGIVRIGITPSLLFSFVTERIREARERLPDVKVELYRSQTSRLQTELCQGAIDVAFMNTKAEAPGCADTLLREDQLLLAYSLHAHQAAQSERPVPIATFEGLPVLTFARNEARANYDVMLGFFAAQGISPKLLEVSGSYVELLGFVKAGLGVAVVPRSVSDVLSIADVGYAEVSPCLPGIPVYASWDEGSDNHALLSMLRLFTEETREAETGGAVERASPFRGEEPLPDETPSPPARDRAAGSCGTG